MKKAENLLSPQALYIRLKYIEEFPNDEVSE